MDDTKKADSIKKANTMAKEILTLSRNTLLTHLRFLDEALSQFIYVPHETKTFCTDGKFLFFSAQHILSNYILERNLPTRDYLHVVFHCIYQHLYCATNMERRQWNLACDIAVECSIASLNLKCIETKRQLKQIPVFERFENQIGVLTAEKVYRLLKESDFSEEEFEELEALFKADEHEIWYFVSPDDNKEEIKALSGKEEKTNENVEQQTNQHARDLRSEQAKIWMDMASKLHLNMETYSKKQGDVSGNIIQNVRRLHSEKYDYTAFLKKFATLGEVMKINDDEFDYIFYTYGLKLYEKMPLIEPLENKEVKRIKEFVIAIDTSGSVRGEVVQAFVQKTYNVLKSTDTFFSKMNLHIFQCDANIQDHVKITTQAEFDEYMKNMKIKGLGGTDYRPVFAKVDEMIMNNEFVDLKGLIYFTDGHGTFPPKKPSYRSAFAFVENEYNNPTLPKWAIKILLNKDEILKDVFKL